MRAKLVNENISFERGKDPRKSMGIGVEGLINSTVWSLNLLPDLYQIVGHDWDYLGHPILIAKVKDPIMYPEKSHVAATDIPGIAIQHSPNELQAYSDIKDKIKEYVQKNESVNFERGQDPKTAMSIGKQADLKREASKIVWDWSPDNNDTEEIIDLMKYRGFNTKIAKVPEADDWNQEAVYYAVSDTGEPYMEGPTFYESPEEAWKKEMEFLDEFFEPDASDHEIII
jgi:hypothetical protein